MSRPFTGAIRCERPTAGVHPAAAPQCGAGPPRLDDDDACRRRSLVRAALRTRDLHDVLQRVVQGGTVTFLTTQQRTGNTVQMSQVKLLTPTAPRKVIAAGLNYRSHLGDQDQAPYPGLFDKHATRVGRLHQIFRHLTPSLERHMRPDANRGAMSGHVGHELDEVGNERSAIDEGLR